MRRIAVDARLTRVVVQRTDTHVAVFRASFDPPELRVKYMDRSVSGRDRSPPAPISDLECEMNRLRAIERQCTSKPCRDEAEKAIIALEAGRCSDARASLGILEAAAEPGTPMMSAIREAGAGLVSVWTTACRR